jgi:acetyl esterase/lipase
MEAPLDDGDGGDDGNDGDGSRTPPDPVSDVGDEEPERACALPERMYDVEVLDPIVYGQDHERQRFAAWLPVGVERAPAIVFVHGGGWWYGTRHDYGDRPRELAERGIAAFSIEYALASETHPAWPDNLTDVVAAVRFIKAHADEYRIEPDAMAAFGASAGGHLAAFLGVLDGTESILEGAGGDPMVRPKVRLVMDYCGYADLEAAAAIDPEDWRVTQMLGATFEENPDLWREASPATWIGQGDAVFVIGQGSDDTTVFPEVSESLHDRLVRAHVPSVLVDVPGGKHGFIRDPDLDRPVRCAFEPLAALLLGQG